MLEVLFAKTVFSKHYIDPKCEANAKLGLLFRSTKNQTGSLEGFNMILWKDIKKTNASTWKGGSCHTKRFETGESRSVLSVYI